MKAVLFDLDHTLIDRDAAFVRWVLPQVPAERLPALVQLDAGGHAPRAPLLRALAELTGAPIGELRRSFFAEIGAHCAPRPGAIELLTRLRGQVRLALVSNGPADLQRHKLTSAGLLDTFDVIVISGELGSRKPDPAPFLAALRRLHLRPEQAGMVGDHPDHDVQPARALGLRTAWVPSRWFDHADADLTLHDLRDLPWP